MIFSNSVKDDRFPWCQFCLVFPCMHNRTVSEFLNRVVSECGGQLKPLSRGNKTGCWNCDSEICFRNKRTEHRSSMSESSSSRSYVSNKGNAKNNESHVNHGGSVASAATSKSLYQREVVAQESEEHIARLSEPLVLSKDAVRYIPPNVSHLPSSLNILCIYSSHGCFLLISPSSISADWRGLSFTAWLVFPPQIISLH